MTDEQRKAIKTTVEYLDSIMLKSPNREVADTCNYLQQLLEEEE